MQTTRLPNNGYYTDKNGTLVNVVNKESTAFKVLPAEDAAIFNGELFKAELKFSLPLNSTKYLVFETPSVASGKIVIWGTDMVKGDLNNIDYRLLEGVTYTDGGAQPVINVNRLSSNLPLSRLWNAATAISTATAVEIDSDCILGSQQALPSSSSIGGNAAGLRFMVLKPATKYALEIKNNDTGKAANMHVKSAFMETNIGG